MKALSTIFLICSLLAYPVFSADGVTVPDTEPDVDRARHIFEQLDDLRSAIAYETSTLEMKIIDSRERVRSRTMKMYTYSESDVTKSLTVFESPADVRGTGLLNLNENGTETQLLYLPAIGRVQTVSGSQRTERFLGSDFTFEDLGNQNPDTFDFELLEDTEEQITLRAVPKDKNSQYAYIHFVIDADKLVLLKADYFDSDDVQIKELNASEFKNIRDNIWRADLMIMKDLRTERRTELRWNQRTFDEAIPERYFTERHLQRGLQ